MSGTRLRRPRDRPGRRFRVAPEDPLGGLANLADLMLVFSAGLLVALVLAWDLARALDPTLSERLRLLDSLRSARELDEAPPSGGAEEPDVRSGVGRYQGIGQVYRDTVTGKLFVVEEPK